MIDLPTALLCLTLTAYWSGVAVMAFVQRRRHGRVAGIWPSNRAERVLWLVWAPLIALWNVLPWLMLLRSCHWLEQAVPATASLRADKPLFLSAGRKPMATRRCRWVYAHRYDFCPLALSPPFRAWRLVAALLGLGCFAATVLCWRQLGKNWSVAVVPGQKAELVRTGPYAVVRHPIYAFSIALMICSVAVVPTVPMFVLAVLHLLFTAIKAYNEEHALYALHGESYTEYCRRTGRFFPRLRAK